MIRNVFKFCLILVSASRLISIEYTVKSGHTTVGDDGFDTCEKMRKQMMNKPRNKRVM